MVKFKILSWFFKTIQGIIVVYTNLRGATMSQKVLHLEESPTISYHNTSYFLSISLNSNDALAWMYSNFIQLYTSEDDKEILFYRADDLKYYPWMEYSHLDKFLVKQHKIDILDLIRDYIDREYYIYIFLNKYYISRTTQHHKRHHIHDLLIHGYDEKKKQLYVTGYNDRQTYTSWWIPITDFIQSFETEQYDSNEVTLKMTMMKCNQHYTYRLDLNNMLDLSRDYLLARNTSERTRTISNPNYRAYGIGVYDKLIAYFSSRKQLKLDLRPLRILWEHKKIMVQRLFFLKENNIISNTDLEQGFQELENEANIVRALALKCIISQNHELISHIISKLETIKQRETRLFKILVNELEAASFSWEKKTKNIERMWQFYNQHLVLKEVTEDPAVAVQMTNLLYAVGKDKIIIDILLFRMPIGFVATMFRNSRVKMYEVFMLAYDIIKDRMALHSMSFISHIMDKYTELFLHVDDLPFRESILRELDFLYMAYKRPDILALRENLYKYRRPYIT